MPLSISESPDFYLVAGHGTGSASLQIYCRILGLPLMYPNRPLPRLKKPLPAAGAIIDRPVTTPSTWEHNKPVFWLLRDPFAALFNVINNNLWLSSSIINHRNWPISPEKIPLRSFFYGYRAALCLCPSTSLKSVYSGKSTQLYCIDHKRLYQDSIQETMLFIGKILGIDLHNVIIEHETQLSIAYGDRVKRLWTQAPRHFILRRIKDLVLRCCITVCPVLWLEFKYANYDSYRVLETFNKNGEDFAIVCDDVAAARNQDWVGMPQPQLIGELGLLPFPTQIATNPKDIKGLHLTDWERIALMKSMELFNATLELHKDFLEKQLQDRDALFEQIWLDAELRPLIKALLDQEMPMIRELAPEIYEGFSYVHEFYRRFEKTSPC